MGGRTGLESDKSKWDKAKIRGVLGGTSAGSGKTPGMFSLTTLTASVSLFIST
jgi:hypothetical protein